MNRSLLRLFVLTLLVTFSAAVASLMADEPAGCQTCRTVMMDAESTMSCTAPDNNEWGYDSCSTGVRQGINGDVHWCRVGGSMCYYFEVY